MPADFELELVFQVSALALATAVSAVAIAPVLPHDVKQQINETTGGDLDKSHETLKTHLMLAVEKIETGIAYLTSDGQGHVSRPRKAASNKCKEQEIGIGKWVFTVPSPHCV